MGENTSLTNKSSAISVYLTFSDRKLDMEQSTVDGEWEFITKKVSISTLKFFCHLDFWQYNENYRCALITIDYKTYFAKVTELVASQNVTEETNRNIKESLKTMVQLLKRKMSK